MLKHLMNDTVEIKSVQSADFYDLPIFRQIKTVKCKFEFAASLNDDDFSSSVTKPARLFCAETDISVGDIVSYNSKNFKVIQVNKYDDLDGNDVLCEVFLK